MACRRCSRCGVNYPATYQYTRCPACKGETSHISNSPAHEDWKERAFDAHYAMHDASREGPDPDALGREEARRLLALDFPTPDQETDGC